MKKEEQKKAIVFGGTGATGSVIVDKLLESDKWSEVLVVGRRELPEWVDKGSKLKLKTVESLDLLKDSSK